MVVTAPGGPTITVVIRQGPMILNCCVCDASAPIGYVQTLSGLTTTPDQVHQRAERSATEIGQCVQHITTAVGRLKVLDQLSEGAPGAGVQSCTTTGNRAQVRW
jgi:hypothetical protein